jgi:hypothetical protein
VEGKHGVYAVVHPRTPPMLSRFRGNRQPLLTDADAFRELHDTIFPGTYKDRSHILADRNANHHLFAYREGTLLGYRYASPMMPKMEDISTMLVFVKMLVDAVSICV